MVGTRRPTRNAQELCRRLVKSLQGTRAVVVSGLAQGIDSYCHEAALEFGIPTIAVIAQGLDVAIPGERRELARRIVESGGCIMSEYENDFPAFKGNFPARNRIISGLGDCLIVMEARTRSGSMTTVQHALNQGKDVFVYPGEDELTALALNAYRAMIGEQEIKEYV